MIECWETGDRHKAGLLAQALVRNAGPHCRRVWLMNAVAILNYLDHSQPAAPAATEA